MCQIGGMDVEVVRKKIKNLHIGCYPPDGRVRVAAPENVSGDAIRLAVLTRMPWIRQKQTQFQSQERQSPRRYISGETHFLLGRALRLNVVPWDKKVHRISVQGDERLQFCVPRDSSLEQRRKWMRSWYKSRLRDHAEPKVEAWSSRLGVDADQWGIRPMKTMWGSCNAKKRIIWLNLELAKKAPAMIDYVILHELAHLVSPRHDDLFISVLDKNMPGWRTIRAELNSLPLTSWDDAVWS